MSVIEDRVEKITQLTLKFVEQNGYSPVEAALMATSIIDAADSNVAKVSASEVPQGTH